MQARPPTPRPDFIKVESARKVYATGRDTVEAVSDVSFSVTRGEFVAILGPSGCGKSTLLMMCAGLESITSGRIGIDSMPMTGPRESIGVMFQDSTLLPWKSVLENILFPVRIMRRPVRDYMDRARSLLAMTGLTGFEHKKPHQLSGGMRQRAAICRALVTDPDILLMDEPFSALDAMTRDEMNEALLGIWDRQPKTALFVTHSIREAVLLADRVLVMTRRPATVVEDLRIPFPRPRDPSIGESEEFNRLVRHLRGLIERGPRGAGAPPAMAATP
ncbi:ABC transporter ATP-binding protein [Roseomonas acroporae]|uniref:ABC transporter ATP-binding protein n=1 Tax=Roseomonas acroporae TaxID=2937791 RepID=UPI00200A4171